MIDRALALTVQTDQGCVSHCELALAQLSPDLAESDLAMTWLGLRYDWSATFDAD